MVKINSKIPFNLLHNLIKKPKMPIINLYNLHEFFNNFLIHFFFQQILYLFFHIQNEQNLSFFNYLFQKQQNESIKIINIYNYPISNI